MYDLSKSLQSIFAACPSPSFDRKTESRTEPRIPAISRSLPSIREDDSQKSPSFVEQGKAQRAVPANDWEGTVEWFPTRREFSLFLKPRIEDSSPMALPSPKVDTEDNDVLVSKNDAVRCFSIVSVPPTRTKCLNP